MYEGAAWGGSGIGGGFMSPPCSNPFNDPYGQLQAQQLSQAGYWNPLAQQYTPVAIAAAVPTGIPEVESSECAEFAWLRKRVNEILWK